MTRIIYCDTSKFMIVFFIVFSIIMIFSSNYFLKSVSADLTVPRYDGEIIFPTQNNASVNTNETVSIMPQQKITNVNTNHTVSITPMPNITYNMTNPAEGFSNISCKSGYQYVQMTGQYTAGNVSYKVIFLRMLLLDNNGLVLAKGFGLVGDIDANQTKTFNAITRYPSTFSSCTIQIDNAIPK